MEAGVPGHDDWPSDNDRALAAGHAGVDLQEHLSRDQSSHLIHDSQQQDTVWHKDACLLFQGLRQRVNGSELGMPATALSSYHLAGVLCEHAMKRGSAFTAVADTRV